MATLQDRYNPSRKARVTIDGEQVFIGNQSDGSMLVTDSGDESQIIDDVSTANITYFCYAPTGTLASAAAWKIKVIDETVGYPVFKYANGSDSYTNIATSRTSLSYS